MRHNRLRFGVKGRSSLTVGLLAIFVAAAPATSTAQEMRPNLVNHVLRCSVADSSGRALSGISLELRSTSPPLEQIRSLTESDGSYTFAGLREGEYVLTVAGGILLPPKHVQVNANSVAILALRLPLALPSSAGHNAHVVSVQQLNVPAKVQEDSLKASQAWTRNDFRQSRLLAQHALQLRPDYAPALELLGMIDLAERHPEEAIAELLQALRQNPSSPRTYLVLASAYNELRQNDEALYALSLLAKLAPEVWQLHYERGRALLGQSHYDAAMLEFDRAQTASRPENNIVHLGKAHAMLGLGNYAGAHDELDTVVRNSPDGPFAAESRELAGVLDSHLKKAPGSIQTAASGLTAPRIPQ